MFIKKYRELLLKKKKYIIVPLAIFAFVVFILVAIQVSLNIFVDEAELRQKILQTMKDAGFAATFHELQISPAGNIVLGNLVMTAGSDFNDDRATMRCQEAVLYLHAGSLLKKNPVVSCLRISSPTIQLNKPYGISHEEFWKSIGGNLLNAGGNTDILQKIEISDAVLVYTESFADGVQKLEYRDAKIELEAHDENVSFAMHAEPGTGQDSLSLGDLDAEGLLVPGTEKDPIRILADLRLKMSDLRLLDLFLHDQMAGYMLSGWADIELSYLLAGQELTLQGNAEVYGLNLAQKTENGANANLVQNVNARADFDVSSDDKSMTVRRLALNDGNINLVSRFVWRDDEAEKLLEGNWSLAPVSLEKAGRSYIPWPGIEYHGSMKTSGVFVHDVLNARNEITRIKSSIKDLEVTSINSLQDNVLLKKADFSFSADRHNAKTMMSLLAPGVDCSFESVSGVYSYWPMRSVSSFSVKSEKIDLLFLAEAGVRAVNMLHDAAQADMAVGYSEDFLTKKLSGYLLRSNDFEGYWQCAGLVSSEQNVAKNIRLNCSMSGGKMDLVLDWPEKNPGSCSLWAKGDFSADKAIVKIEGEMDEVPVNIKLGDFSVKGLLGWDWDYSLTGYRLKHAIENRTLAAQASISEATVSSGSMGVNFNSFLDSAGAESKPVIPATFKAREISIMYSENGLIPYIQMLTIDSDPFFCALSGPYNYYNGMYIGFEFIARKTVMQDDLAVVSEQRLPLVVTGYAHAPVITAVRTDGNQAVVPEYKPWSID